MKSANEYISLSDAAEMLQVSGATVSNWIRSGIIEKDHNGILSVSVRKVKNKISSGEIKKLKFRANKTFSSDKFRPREISDGQNSAADMIYQAHKTMGTKSKEGSFYTPDFLIDEITADYQPDKGAKICDPCCGTGRFIKNIAKKYDNKLFLYGFDTDKNAAEIAVRDLKSSVGKKIKIKHFDSLINPEKDKYDFIFTNPPWGAHYSGEYKNILKKLYPEAGSEDSLEYFLLYAFRSVRQDGIISYILPESFLFVRKFKKIREFLLKNTTILKINLYGRIFSKVFSSVIRIDIKKTKPDLNHKIITDRESTLQSYFMSDADCVFDVMMSDADRKKISGILSSPYITLKNNADWSLGIVTGDNKRFVSNDPDKDFPHEIITGKNIEQYKIAGEKKFLFNDFSGFQQISKTDHFKVKEKLIYKFISDRLVFAYDTSGVITLNSANVMIPKLENYTVRSVMAILNSDLMNFIYQKKIKNLKVLRTNIEKLPFPENPDRKIINLIDRKTNCIINNCGDIYKLRLEIEELVYKLFGVKNESTISDPKKKIISRT